MDTQDRLITSQEAEKILGMGRHFLDKNRMADNPIPFIKIGNRIRYKLQDIEDFIEANRTAPKSVPAIPEEPAREEKSEPYKMFRWNRVPADSWPIFFADPDPQYSIRVAHILHTEDMDSVHQLADLSRAEFMRYPNFGAKSYSWMKARLAQHGILLYDYGTPPERRNRLVDSLIPKGQAVPEATPLTHPVSWLSPETIWRDGRIVLALYTCRHVSQLDSCVIRWGGNSKVWLEAFSTESPRRLPSEAIILGWMPFPRFDIAPPNLVSTSDSAHE